MAELAPRLNIELSAFKAFSMTTQDKADAGYMLDWSFASGPTLDADLSVPNPENPDKKIKVVAVLDAHQYWEGGRTKPKQIQGRISEKNRSKLINAMHAGSGGTEQKLSIKIVRYNEEGKVYFEHFAFEGAECVFTPGVKLEVFSKPCEDVPQPPNYFFNISFTPKGSAPEHEFRCAESPTDKVVVPWGGVGAG